jgi:hypothetical protein
MLCAFRAFLDFCYTARRAYLTDSHLEELDKALAEFQQYRRVFAKREDETGHWITAPRQHSMVHYRHITELFGAPNGLCSLITESKHIVAVKKPYRRTNHHQPLAQMILINQRQEKLAACRHALEKRGLLSTTALEHALDSIKVANKVEAEDSLIHDGIGPSDDAESESLEAVEAQSNWEDVPIGNSADADDIQLCEPSEPDSDEEDGAVDVPQAASHVMMAKLHRKLQTSLVSYFFMTLTLSMQEPAYRVSFDLFRLCSRYLD